MDCEYIRFNHYIDLNPENDYYDTTCVSPNKCFTVCSANPNIRYRPKGVKNEDKKKENMNDTKSVTLSFCPCGKMPIYKYYKTQYPDGEREFISIQCSDPNCKKIQLNVAYPTAEMAEIDWNDEVQKYNFNENLSKQLSPCLCGGQAKVFSEDIVDFYIWYIRCDKCGRILTANPNPYKLIKRWNDLAALKGKDTDDME